MDSKNDGLADLQSWSTAAPDRLVPLPGSTYRSESLIGLEVARLTLTGTHRGDYLGQPPTGKSFEIGSLDIYKFHEGRIMEGWGISDATKMAEQLGW